MIKYLVIIGFLAASQPFLVAHSETPKIDTSLEEVYQVAYQGTALLPINPAKTTVKPNNRTKTYHVSITAYSSEPEQTDSTPFITASGAHVRPGVAAANFLPLGTAIRIPELFGDRVFIIEDRMNKRFSNKVDIWFPEKSQAKIFGLQRATIEVL